MRRPTTHPTSATASIARLSVFVCVLALPVPLVAAQDGGSGTSLPPVDVVTPEAAPDGESTGNKPKTKAKSGAVSGPGGAGGGQGIAVLVNDDPVTAYEIEQRQRLMGMGSGNIKEKANAAFQAMLKAPSTSERLKAILKETIEANRGKSKEQIIPIFEARKKQFALTLQKQAIDKARSSLLPAVRKQAIDELIDERLKLQEAKRLNVLAPDEEVDRVIKGIAERNKMTPAEFDAYLKGNGANIVTMRDKFRATLSWNDVIKRRFGHQVSVASRDVDRFVATTGSSDGDDEAELQIHRVTLPIAGQLEQSVIAARFQEAESLRGKFGGCQTTAGLANVAKDVRFEDLGNRKLSTIPEPTRTMLVNAKDGDMLPPSVGAAGVELWAVCGRQTTKADEKKRIAAQDQLRQNEFELLAKRHLKDLRQDAHIEYR